MSTLRLAPPLLCAGALFAAAPAGAASLTLPIGPVYDDRINITVPRPATRPVTLSRLSLQAFGSLEAFEQFAGPDVGFSVRVSGFGGTVVTYANLGNLFNGDEADDRFDLPGDVGQNGVLTPTFSTEDAILIPADGRNAQITSILVLDVPVDTFSPAASPFTPPPGSPFFFAIQGEAVIEFDDAVWIAPAGGAWDDDANWSIGETPGGFVDIGYRDVVLIDPEISQTIDGPEGLSELGSLRLGGGAGRAELAMQGGAIVASDSISVGADGVLSGEGTLRVVGPAGIESAGKIEGGDLVLEGDLENAGEWESGGVLRGVLTNRAGGEIEIGAGETLELLLGDPPASRSNGNLGDIEVFGGALESKRAFINDSRILARDANLDFEGGFVNGGDVLLSGANNDIEGAVENLSNPFVSGLISNAGGGLLTFYDAVTNEGTIETLTGGRTVFLDGYTGSGALTGGGDFFMRGTFAPGSSPGLTDVTGDLTLTGSSLFEVGGLLRGTEYDATDVSGVLTLGGDLTIVNFGDFAASPGDRFTLFMASEILGDFDSISFPDLDVGFWRVFRTDTEFGVEAAVPLPAAGWMLIAGLGALAALRRRAA